VADLKKVLVVSAVSFLLLYALIDVFQYRNALTTMATITSVAEKCTYEGTSLRVNCGMRAVKVVYQDGDIERVIDRTYQPGSRKPWANVGMKVSVVYVPGNPLRTRFGGSRWDAPRLIAWMLLSGIIATLWIRWTRSRGWEARNSTWRRRAS
jgi:hypothetical protein